MWTDSSGSVGQTEFGWRSGSERASVGQRFPRPSVAGRRLALQRKFEINLGHYGGAVSILTITAPGEDVLPWECAGGHQGKCSGEHGCVVAWPYDSVFNGTAQARMSRMFEAAQRFADRQVRAHGYSGELPRQLGNVRVPQLRGVYHFHYALPEETPVEKLWSRCVRRFIRAVWQAEKRRFTPDEGWHALEREYLHGQITRGVYGFGFSHPGKIGGGDVDLRRESAAKYLARNAAAYLGGQGGRHYVASRLVGQTGATMRVLRACNWLYVRRKQGLDPLIPAWWPESFTAAVVPVFALVDGARAP